MTMKNETSQKAGAACGKAQAKAPAPAKKEVKAESKPVKGAKK